MHDGRAQPLADIEEFFLKIKVKNSYGIHAQLLYRLSTLYQVSVVVEVFQVVRCAFQDFVIINQQYTKGEIHLIIYMMVYDMIFYNVINMHDSGLMFWTEA